MKRIRNIIRFVACCVGIVFYLQARIVLEKGVILTVETSASKPERCHIEWTASSPGGMLSEDGARDVPVPEGVSEVRVCLPVDVLKGVRFTAPGVRLGVVRIIGDGCVLRSETAADLPQEIKIPATRYPVWRNRSDGAKDGQ